MLLERASGQLASRWLSIQLSLGVSLVGCTRCTCLNKPKGCTQFSIR